VEDADSINGSAPNPVHVLEGRRKGRG